MKNFFIASLALGLGLGLGACNLDIGDLNNPGLDDLENNPTRVKVGAAANGLFIGDRANFAAENGYVSQLGILGREAYCFDGADPRFVGELLQGTLNAGSPFGGAFWLAPYANVRDANILLHALDKVPAGELSDAEKSGVRGFAATMQAVSLLQVVATHDTSGEVIDTDGALLPIPELGAIVDPTAALTKIAALLDGAVTDLSAGGDAFSFALSPGYAGFDTPATFLKFNRAMRARVAVYQKDYAAAMTAVAASFIDDSATADFRAGVYHVFGTNNGDTANSLVSPSIYAHPSLQTDAKMKANGMPDDRFTSKVTTATKPGSAQDHSSTLAFTLYPTPTTPVPIIRNEELILIRAEAEIGLNMLPAAIIDLNTIRTRSGGLAARADLTAANIEDELLYNRRYSLLFEGGHRWIDVRRFGRETDLPLDVEGDVRNMAYPIPTNECNARPGDSHCPAM